MSGGALADLAVIEVGHGIAGAFAARLLGDLGADVVKVERPGRGDFVRRLAPLEPDGSSALFSYLNWNKRGVELELTSAAGRDALRALLERADVLIDSLAPGRLEALELAPATLRERNPRLVVTSISSFGASGPYAGWLGCDVVFAAMSGLAQISGSADREPLKRGLRQSYYCAGINAAYASLAGHLAALRTGAGAHIDLAIRECPASELVLNESHFICTGAIQGRRPPLRDPLGGPLGGGDPLPAAGGHIALQVTPTVPVERLAELLCEPRLADPRFASSEGRAARAAELVGLLSACLEGRDPQAFFVEASQAGLLCGIVQGAADLLACPQLRAREVWQGVPGAGALEFPAALATLSRTPTTIRRRAPALGEHTAEVLGELNATPRRAAAAAVPASAAPVGPLAGLRVLDLSYVFAAPYVGALLADLGAEVIKVEAPHRLDQSRTTFSPLFENDPGSEPWNRAGAFHVVNRGKRSLSLDLGDERGRALLVELVRDADVLIENFTPRVMRGWGLRYEQLSAANPRLVMLSNTGFGSSGPWSEFRAQGTTLEATMGLSRYAGYSDGPPSKVGQSYPDFLACWTGLLMVLAALVERERSGAGQWIDLGMYQLGAAVIPEALLAWQLGGGEPARSASGEPDLLLSAVVRTSGEDRWLAVGAWCEAQLAALRGVVGAPADGEPAAALAAWARERDAGAAAATLQAAGVPAGAVLDAGELFDDPQLRHRGFHEWARCGDGVARPLIGRPYCWTGATTAVAIGGAGPDFGEAAEHVLDGLLGVRREAADALRADGVVADAPRGPAPIGPIDLALMTRSGAIARVDPDYRRVHRNAPRPPTEEPWTVSAKATTSS